MTGVPHREACRCPGRFFASTLLLILSASGSHLFGAEAAASLPSIQEIATAIKASRKNVDSLRLTIQDFTRVHDGKRREADGVAAEVQFAFDGDRRFFSERSPIDLLSEITVNEAGVGTRKASARELAAMFGTPPMTSEIRAFDGSRYRSLRGTAVGVIHSLSTLAVVPGSNFDVFYLRCVGWFVLDPTAPSSFEILREKDCFPGALTAAQPAYAITTDRLGTLDCLRLHISANAVAKRASDSIWLVPNLGYLQIRRHYADDQGRPLLQIDSADPVQIVPGLWLPRLCTYRQFEAADAEHPDGRLIQERELRLASWDANRVDPALFQLAFPPGAMVEDYVATQDKHLSLEKPIVRMPPVSSEKLDKALERIVPRRIDPWRVIFCTVTLLFLIAILVRRAFRRNRAKKT